MPTHNIACNTLSYVFAQMGLPAQRRARPLCGVTARSGGADIAKHLVVPANITIMNLPAKCPELNPQENVWQFIRDNCSPTAFSPTTRISSTTAAGPGEISPTCLRRSCPLDCATGRMGTNESALVLGLPCNDIYLSGIFREPPAKLNKPWDKMHTDGSDQAMHLGVCEWLEQRATRADAYCPGASYQLT